MDERPIFDPDILEAIEVFRGGEQDQGDPAAGGCRSGENRPESGRTARGSGTGITGVRTPSARWPCHRNWPPGLSSC